MARFIPIVAVVLVAVVSRCAAQQANPWNWQKDQNKYALYDGGGAHPKDWAFSVNPPACTDPIYVDEKKKYRDYAGHVALSYRALYRLTEKQYRILFHGLLRQYDSKGVRAADVHSFLESQLKDMISSNKYEHWQRIKIYPEYDPYYLEWGRPVRDRSYSLQ